MNAEPKEPPINAAHENRFITYTHCTGGDRFRQRLCDPLPAWAYDVREEVAAPNEPVAPLPSADTCEHCQGAGEVFTHADDCGDDLCALNGDMHSCVGQLVPCDCAVKTGRAERASPQAVPAEFCWLVELFEPSGNSLGHYHTGFSDTSWQSRSTKDPHQARRYNSKEEAERAASELFSKAGVWRAVEHGFVAVPQAVDAPVAPDVDATIIKVILPQCYALIRDLLRDDTPKDLVIRAKRLLPAVTTPAPKG
jgi:hypothetical protein